MAALERTYTIPLRREWLKSVKYKRAKKAVRAIKEFLVRHMKTAKENVRLGTQLNIELWKHGIKNPPSRIKVNVTKDDKGMVRAELFGAKVKAPKKAETAKLTDAKTAITAEQKEVAKTGTPAEATKLEEKKPTPKRPAAPKALAQPAPAKQPAAPKQQAGQMIR